VWGGFSEQMERAESTQFCLSCHVMTDFGRSLYVDDPSYLPARHFQNNLVPRDRACYTCHTDYAMFGTVRAKLRGLRHIQVQYFGTIPKPEEIKLYSPYNNRECLHCHLGARRFEEGSGHHKTPDLLQNVKSGQQSCLSCHDIVHDIGSLKDAAFWKENK
jgi:cytochrome c-type protein NapC